MKYYVYSKVSKKFPIAVIVDVNNKEVADSFYKSSDGWSVKEYDSYDLAIKDARVFYEKNTPGKKQKANK